MSVRFSSVALVVVAFALVSCGGDGSEDAKQAQGCNYNYNTVVPGPANTVAPVPIEQAKELAGFELLLPRDVPDGVTNDAPYGLRSSSCPDDVLDVTINYQGPDHEFALIETKLKSEVGTSATPVKINGVDGKMRYVESETPMLLVEWRQGGVTITATAGIRGEMTETRFLQILESIPE